MKFFQKCKKQFSDEITKLKGLSAKDKLWYVWEYYKLHIAVVICIIVTVSSILGNLLNSKEPYLHYAVINLSSLAQAEPVPLTEEAHAAFQLDEDDFFSVDTYLFTISDLMSPEDYTSFQEFQLQVYVSDLDMMFMTEADCYALSSAGLFCDLESILPEDLWEKIKDHVIYLPDPVTGETIPAALSLSHCSAIERCEFLSDSVVLCVSPTSNRTDNCVKMIRYIFESD